MKAYSTCVGAGPFTCELFGEEGEELRRAGNEYGAATGRPRRVGGFDVVASKYGIMMQGATEIALTKLDVLSYLDRIPVCVKYDVNGRLTTELRRPSRGGSEIRAVYFQDDRQPHQIRFRRRRTRRILYNRITAVPHIAEIRMGSCTSVQLPIMVLRYWLLIICVFCRCMRRQER